MTHQQAVSGAGFVGLLRAGLAAVIAVAFIALVFFLAAFVTMAALVAAGGLSPRDDQTKSRTHKDAGERCCRCFWRGQLTACRLRTVLP